LDSHPRLPLAVTLPLAVRYRDPAGPFAIDATVVAWRVEERERGAGMVRLTLGSGTLDDADKGRFPLVGLELTMRLTDSGVEPAAVLNPGVLSEFQQDGLLDAVSTCLNARAPDTPTPGGRS
jgi:hypothetical protein